MIIGYWRKFEIKKIVFFNTRRFTVGNNIKKLIRDKKIFHHDLNLLLEGFKIKYKTKKLNNSL